MNHGLLKPKHQAVYNALIAAVEAGQRCPPNAALQKLTGHKSASSIDGILKALEGRDLIRVLRRHDERVVMVTSLRRGTATRFGEILELRGGQLRTKVPGSSPPEKAPEGPAPGKRRAAVEAVGRTRDRAGTATAAGADDVPAAPLSSDGTLPQVVQPHVGWFKTCQWPFGDPGEPDFHFCGKAAVPERPYCADHCAKAYIAPSRGEKAA